MERSESSDISKDRTYGEVVRRLSHLSLNLAKLQGGVDFSFYIQFAILRN